MKNSKRLLLQTLKAPLKVSNGKQNNKFYLSVPVIITLDFSLKQLTFIKLKNNCQQQCNKKEFFI
jgi:hypothetical protein